MRSLEFRIWDKKLQGFLTFKLIEKGLMILSKNAFSEDDNRKGQPIEQFTGLKDKNGTKIFEGDVTNKGVVKYCERECLYTVGDNGNIIQEYVSGTKYPLDHRNYEIELEVIGNIHEEATK